MGNSNKYNEPTVDPQTGRTAKTSRPVKTRHTVETSRETKTELIAKPDSQIKPTWNDEVPRLILYADFMGFKNRVYSSSHNDLKQNLEKFNDAWHKRLEPLQLGGDLKFVQFSDSILVGVNGTSKKMFNLISKAAISMMHESLQIKFGIKGVIAQGIFSFDEKKGLYFGIPLIDAYILHEEIKFYGIVVHHTAENTVKNNLSRNNPYAKNNIYIEKGKVSHYHLCWNLVDTKLAPNDITPTCNSWLDAIEETVSGAPRQYIDRTREIMKNDQSELIKNKNAFNTLSEKEDLSESNNDQAQHKPVA